MTLSLPTAEELFDFWGADAEADTDRADLLIQLSADLLWLATKIEDDPADPRLANLVKYAILDMAAYLYINRDSINENYSPFNSERIGSYSYSKMYSRAYSRLSKTITGNEPTGVPLFDRVVDELLDAATFATTMTVGGEHIFAETYLPYQWEVHGWYNHANQDAWPRV